MTGIKVLLGLSACLVASGGSAVGASITLADIEFGSASPTGNYRWLDVADQLYSAAYRGSYNYTKAQVQVTFETPGQSLRGVLAATNLKPNFAYQLKLEGTPGTPGGERIGLVGRWWQEEWNGAGWVNGANLNDKGTGYAPTPNDTTYFSRRDVADSTSPTGKHYKFTGYWVLGYFITDSQGNVALSFEGNSSYHVLWKTIQRARESADGPLQTTTFTPSTSQPAYAADYPQTTISIFGEWERLPVGGIHLAPGEYDGRMILTEESFHGSGGQYAGGWAAAMSSDISFECIAPTRPRLSGVAVTNGMVTFDILDCPIGITNQVERSFDLKAASAWASVFTFLSTTASTNWSEPLIGTSSGALYRVKSQLPP
jgi:hypothetical protein